MIRTKKAIVTIPIDIPAAHSFLRVSGETSSRAASGVYQDEAYNYGQSGLANFLYYVEVSSDANIKYSISDVDHVIIGKRRNRYHGQ
ncbi:MAG: hypothetical protein R2912_05140 [Eubacteriales bacterium]